MKCTPQNTITSAEVLAAFLDNSKGVADEIGNILDVWGLVIVRKHHSIPLLFEQLDRRDQGVVNAHWDPDASGWTPA
jgi:hypothetical protein